MNDVRKWAADVIDNAEPGDAEDDLARELLDFIGRDAEPDPWEEVADRLASELSRLGGNRAACERALAAYENLKNR